jgi:hypothetical protein
MALQARFDAALKETWANKKSWVQESETKGHDIK